MQDIITPMIHLDYTQVTPVSIGLLALRLRIDLLP